eukprot:CAMPEP_0170139266 /NCGR_PEP_ID=MMETSP0033_2-20121228/5526_1 /TAXON_ID=195969 /ORGANISM="Dolichomastix tenuilepis, Strain CCMP3274" /LENGTH=198 /DNA_ID=CAMNT_0010375365 /DNA_START=216 /DNA_END=812 /DNA_ORIENTATION=+
MRRWSTAVAVVWVAATLGTVAAAVDATGATVPYTPLSAFPNRYATTPCSLIAADDKLGEGCQLKSLLGKENGRLLMSFGERNCTVTLRGCKSGVCYSTRDSTGRLPQDSAVPRSLPSSFFSSVRVVAGGKPFADGSTVRFSRDGFAFTPDADQVTLSYDTHTCAEFYSYRGRVPEQRCLEPQRVLTALDHGLAIDSLC